MKEQGPNPIDPKLTRQSDNSTLKKEGNILMEEPGNTEGQSPEQPVEAKRESPREWAHEIIQQKGLDQEITDDPLYKQILDGLRKAGVKKNLEEEVLARYKVQKDRRQSRESKAAGASGPQVDDKEFKLSYEWQEVPEGTIFPPFVEFKMDVGAGGKTYARWPKKPGTTRQSSDEEAIPGDSGADSAGGEESFGASEAEAGAERMGETTEDKIERLFAELSSSESFRVLNSKLYELVEIYEANKGEDQEKYKLVAARLSEIISNQIDRYPVVEAAGVDHELLELASHFKELREKLVNRILFRAYEDQTETNDYRESMNLYAQGNLETLLGYMSKTDPEKYAYFTSLRTAAQLFHQMNSTILSGNLDEFLQHAERINYQHFNLMKEITGVSEAMRIYEQKYQDYLSRDGSITTENYKELKADVERFFKLSNERGLLESAYSGDRMDGNPQRLTDWEMNRALNVARTFFNISFRGAEQVASGRVPKRVYEPGKTYASFPQENLVKIVNWIQFANCRFEIASSRGGMQYIEMVKKRFARFLESKDRKLGINDIRILGGMNIDELEAGGMFGASGVYSSWRIETMAFSTIKLKNGQTIKEWLREKVKDPDSDDSEKMIFRAEKIDRIRSKVAYALKHDKTRDRVNEYQRKLLNELEGLIEGTDMGLGILLKHSMFSEYAGYAARARLWEKVVDTNVPLIIDYLQNFKTQKYNEDRIGEDDKKEPEKNPFKDKSKGKIEGENIILRILAENESFLDDEGNVDMGKWQALKDKIFLKQEYAIRKAMGRIPSGANRIEFESATYFNNDEIALIFQIQHEARSLRLPEKLADIAFPYVPFMNDVPFELLDYSGPGEEFYRRRAAGDLGSYSKGEGAFTAITNNPGGLEPDEALKQLDAIIKAVESPQGTPDAQERVFPMFDCWIDFNTTFKGKRQALTKEVLHAFKHATSLAQQWSGMEAHSFDENDIKKITEQATKIGILNEEQAKDMRKKKKVTFQFILWALLRDMFWVPFVEAGKDIGKESLKPLMARS